MSNIPLTLEECFPALQEMLSAEDFEYIVKSPQNNLIELDHSLGRWIRNNWDLWKGGILSDYFKSMGIHHPDDMSGIILNSFWLRMNNKPLNLDDQIKHYQDYWAKKDNHET